MTTDSAPVLPDWISRKTMQAGDLSNRQIDAMCRTGQLKRLRPGRYTPAQQWSAATEQQRHGVRALELGDFVRGRGVVSHVSAAVLLGLQFADMPMPRVHITWPGSPGRRGTANITPHRGRLPDDEIAWVQGIPVTAPARTVFDVARTAPPECSLSVADSALRLKLCTEGDLRRLVEAHRQVPGAFQARRIIEFADGRAQSVGESICRLRLAQLGFPRPDLQVDVPLAADETATVDFEFTDYRVVAEFDGKLKYGRLLRPGQDPGEVVFAEKVREDRIRDTGRECVRVIWADFGRSQQLQTRVRGAFRRAGFRDLTSVPARFLAPRSFV